MSSKKEYKNDAGLNCHNVKFSNKMPMKSIKEHKVTRGKVSSTGCAPTILTNGDAKPAAKPAAKTGAKK
jgi:hypothetical protein